MSYCMFRESKEIWSPIPDQSMICFDVLRYLSGHHVPAPPDYEYRGAGMADEGAIEIRVPGCHLIIWTISQMTGRAPGGEFFQLRFKSGGQWLPLGGAAHLKSSSSSGLGAITALPYDPLRSTPLPPGSLEMDASGIILIGLFNVSGSPIQINRKNYLKASLIILGPGAMGPDPDFSGMLGPTPFTNELDYLLAFYSSLTLVDYESLYGPGNTPPAIRNRMQLAEEKDRAQNHDITFLASEPEAQTGLLDLFSRCEKLFKDMTLPSQVTNLRSRDIPGLGVSVLSTGYMYNFWNYGSMSSPYPIIINRDAENPEGIVYLAEAVDRETGEVLFEPLTWYQGQATVGMCYVQGAVPGPADGFIPIYFDGTGVYIRVEDRYTFTIKSTYNFIRTLILTAPT